MANQEHLDILKQGVDVWNAWRKEHPNVWPDLSKADLREADLSHVDLSRAYLVEANFSNAFLNNADLSGAYLAIADFSGANLSNTFLDNTDISVTDFIGANLSHSTISRCDLDHANLSNANLIHSSFVSTNFSNANLNNTNLSNTDLSHAIFDHTNLDNADLSNAWIAYTHFGAIDLRMVKGLEIVEHRGPSTIGTDTILRSEGDIPEIFLRGAGLDNTFISYVLALARRPIQYYTCFISYSSKDQAFAEHLYADLQSKNVRCWFDREDLKIGDKFRVRIDESIRLYDKLLLVLSEDSLASNWVAYEVEKALNKEPEGTPNVLFPIRLDNTILTCDTNWAKEIQRSRHIGDFTRWKDHDAYQRAFQRLLRDLKAQS